MSVAKIDRAVRTYRPTWLKAASDHCARAVDFLESGEPYDRRGFEAGIAAHMFLQELGGLARKLGTSPGPEDAATVELLRGVSRELIENGRIFEGRQEPPLSPDLVFEGRELALSYIANQELSPTAEFEVALAIDADRQPVAYSSPRARLRCILDYLDAEEVVGEEFAARTLTIRDYKSAWPTSEAELETVQRKAQAVTAIARYGDVDVLRLEVVNLRLGKAFSREIVMDEFGKALLASWWADLEDTMAALDAQATRGIRPASPGAGCDGCPFLQRCDHAQDFIERSHLHRTAQERARAYAVVCAARDQLGDQLKRQTKEEPIAIPGALVGTVGLEQRELIDEAYRALWDEWTTGDGDGYGFAKGLQLSVKHAENLAKVMFPERADRLERERFLTSLIRMTTRREFGIHRVARKETSHATTDQR